MLFALVVFTFVRRAHIKIGPWDLPIPSGPVTVVQLVVSVIDIVSAGACLYVLIDHPQVPFLAFLVVYAVALMVGVSSHVPGGLGVFESVMLFALHDSVSPENLAAAMLAYRVIYHLIPLVLALFVLVGRELAERASPIVGAVRYIHSWSAELVPPLLAGLAFCNGRVLLVSTATPALPERLKAMKAFMPLVVVEISTISGSVIGLGLLLVARGLYRKLNGAYVITLLLCLGGSVFSPPPQNLWVLI
ncbi:MAG: lysylphosphatidylglycerol synthase domain-containing protein [Gammaproteobacteria bacterium]